MTTPVRDDAARGRPWVVAQGEELAVADVRKRAALGGVRVAAVVLGDEPGQEGLEVAARGGIGVLLDHEAGRGVAHGDRHRPSPTRLSSTSAATWPVISSRPWPRVRCFRVRVIAAVRGLPRATLGGSASVLPGRRGGGGRSYGQGAAAPCPGGQGMSVAAAAATADATAVAALAGLGLVDHEAAAPQARAVELGDGPCGPPRPCPARRTRSRATWDVMRSVMT